VSHLQNITRIKVVHRALGELADDFFFIGGATVSLYTDRISSELRPTDDIDILIELTKYHDFAKMEEKLRSKGFTNDIDSSVICRYKIQGITVDVMPTSANILGFTNKWYEEGTRNGTRARVDENIEIRIFTPVYFLASKFEAFKNRGRNDGRQSSDFEDIIYIFNDRSVVWEEIKTADHSVKDYLINEIDLLLKNKYLDEWIGCHLEYAEQRRIGFIIGSMKELVGLSNDN
jgi:predicted nucleotidyltransferase